MSAERLRIGFIPLCDAAALLIAVDKGFCLEDGLDVELVREVSWSNVRDKLNIGLFDAAHLLAPVAIASTLGLGTSRFRSLRRSISASTATPSRCHPNSMPR
jgi:ABC-type nitrate/sulfonate/bicarbonate transport systems, periplasmic components